MKINIEKLNIAMAIKCMSMSELSKKSRVAPSVLQRVCKEADNLRPTTVGKIAKALDINVIELIEQEN